MDDDKVDSCKLESHYGYMSHEAEDEDEVTVIEDTHDIRKSSIRIEPHMSPSGVFVQPF